MESLFTRSLPACGFGDVNARIRESVSFFIVLFHYFLSATYVHANTNIFHAYLYTHTYVRTFLYLKAFRLLFLTGNASVRICKVWNWITFFNKYKSFTTTTSWGFKITIRICKPDISIFELFTYTIRSRKRKSIILALNWRFYLI